MRWGSRSLAAFLLVAGFHTRAHGQVFRYEGTVLPDPFPWQRIVSGTPERVLENGWLIETVQEGERDLYRYELGGISSLVGRFFIEWRAVTDNPEWLIYESQVPATVVAAGRASSLYHVVMTESAAVLFRDAFIPWVVAPLSAGFHTYRIEVYADEYLWYIDGVVVDSGVPEGAYPDPDAFIIWGVEALQDGAPTATTAFDYLRFGEIPDDASGDYGSDGYVTRGDYRFVHECIAKAGPDLFGGVGQNTGPGCRFTDFDADSDVDLFDFAEFANHFTGFQ